MKKMVVSSFYNSLINEEEAIPTSTMLEIERIRKKGIIFCVCTNRLYEEVLEYNRDFPFLDYIVSLNGSYIYDVKKGKCMYKSKLSKSNINKINAEFSDKPITYYTEKEAYKTLPIDKDIYKIEVEIKEKEEMNKPTKITGNISTFSHQQKQYIEFVSNKSSMFLGVDKIALNLTLSLKDIVVVTSNQEDKSLQKNIPTSYYVNSKDGKELEEILKTL